MEEFFLSYCVITSRIHTKRNKTEAYHAVTLQTEKEKKKISEPFKL